MNTNATDAPGDLPLLPVRMLNEFSYCPRLGYLEWVQGEFADSADTVEGRYRHRRWTRERSGRPKKNRKGQKKKSHSPRPVGLVFRAARLYRYLRHRESEAASPCFQNDEGFGKHLQLSVFQCDLPAIDLIRMQDILTMIINAEEDQVLIFNLGRRKAARSNRFRPSASLPSSQNAQPRWFNFFADRARAAR